MISILSPSDRWNDVLSTEIGIASSLPSFLACANYEKWNIIWNIYQQQCSFIAITWGYSPNAARMSINGAYCLTSGLLVCLSSL